MRGVCSRLRRTGPEGCSAEAKGRIVPGVGRPIRRFSLLTCTGRREKQFGSRGRFILAGAIAESLKKQISAPVFPEHLLVPVASFPQGELSASGMVCCVRREKLAIYKNLLGRNDPATAFGTNPPV